MVVKYLKNVIHHASVHGEFTA